MVQRQTYKKYVLFFLAQFFKKIEWLSTINLPLLQGVFHTQIPSGNFWFLLAFSFGDSYTFFERTNKKQTTIHVRLFVVCYRPHDLYLHLAVLETINIFIAFIHPCWKSVWNQSLSANAICNRHECCHHLRPFANNSPSQMWDIWRPTGAARGFCITQLYWHLVCESPFLLFQIANAKTNKKSSNPIVASNSASELRSWVQEQHATLLKLTPLSYSTHFYAINPLHLKKKNWLYSRGSGKLTPIFTFYISRRKKIHQESPSPIFWIGSKTVIGLLQ